MAQRGGRRTGAGRKPGVANRRTREIADKASETGITPLEVMVEAYRQVYYGASGNERNAVAAFPLAKDCAPYMHAKIQAIELTGQDGVALLSPTIIIGGPPEPCDPT